MAWLVCVPPSGGKCLVGTKGWDSQDDRVHRIDPSSPDAWVYQDRSDGSNRTARPNWTYRHHGNRGQTGTPWPTCIRPATHLARPGDEARPAGGSAGWK